MTEWIGVAIALLLGLIAVFAGIWIATSEEP